MNRFLQLFSCIILLAVSTIYAQAGFKIGVNTSKFTFDLYGQSLAKTGITIGHFREWRLAGTNQDFLKLAFELNFSRKGAIVRNTALGKYTPENSYNWDGHSYFMGDIEYYNAYIQLPLLIKYEHLVSQVRFGVYAGPAYELSLKSSPSRVIHKQVQFIDHNIKGAMYYNDFEYGGDGESWLFKDSEITINCGIAVNVSDFIIDFRDTYSIGKDNIYSFSSYNSLGLSLGYRIK